MFYSHMLEYTEKWSWRRLLSLEDILAYIRHRWYCFRQDRENKK